MKAIQKDFVAKNLFNYWAFFIIIIFCFIVPQETQTYEGTGSFLFNFIEKFSFWLFGEKNLFSSYFPVFFTTIIPLGLLHELSDKIKSAKFAFLNCIILSTCVGYVLFTKLNPIQSISASFALSSVYCSFFTFFVKTENRKYFWIFSLIFLILSGLVDCCHIFPVLLVVLINLIAFKKVKEAVFIGFLAVLALLKFQPTLIFSYKPLISVFIGSCPWILTTLFCFKKFKKIEIENNSDKFLLLNILSIITILICSNLINSQIALIYPFISSVFGYIILEFIVQNENNHVFKSVAFLIIGLTLSIIIGVVIPLFQHESCFKFLINVLGL